MKRTLAASQQQPADASAWYVEAMEQLIRAVQDLSHARDIDAVTAVVRAAARNLTGADGATFVLRDGDQCYYADENAIEPLWKGKRFPLNACVSGWVMLNAQPAVIDDIYSDARVPVEAYRPTFVKSMAMVPIRRNSPIGAIGNYWASKRTPTQEEIAILQALADTTSVALENVELYGKLRRQVHTLEAQQARISEQHEKLETFTRALSHDLKEPVRTMMSFSRMIEEEKDEPEKRETYLGYIRAAADRMGMLIDAVFQYTQLDNPEQQVRGPCAMEDVLGGVKENLAQLLQERGASIISGALPAVEAQPAQMIQVIQNLIANAISHNENAVTVRVEAKAKDDHWLFSVRDDGVGIPSVYQEKIFLPFKRMTHKAGHSGFGLTICAKIIASYGGKLWCESTAGQGATFFFTMPRTTAAKPAPTSGQALANVLLVDDLEGDIELMRRAFSHAKVECNILVARDGEEAHEMLKKSIHGERIHLMLLDVNMPCMDGFELLDRIRKNALLKDMAVVMCTGSVYERDKQRAQELGAVGYLLKPPSMDRLGGIIEHIPELLMHHDGGTNRLIYAT